LNLNHVATHVLTENEASLFVRPSFYAWGYLDRRKIGGGINEHLRELAARRPAATGKLT